MKLLPKFEFKQRHRSILKHIKANRNRLIISGVCSAMIASSTSAMGYLIRPVIDDVFVNKDTTGLVMLPVGTKTE